MATLPDYVELHAFSNFTFLRGASHPEELIAGACEQGYRALAITDECSLAGVVRAHIAARDYGLRLIIGAEFSLADGPRLVLLATNRQGYGNLCELITRARQAADKGTYHLTHADLAGGVPECLALLMPDLQPDPEALHWFARTFPQRAWLAVELLCGTNDKARLRQLQQLGKDIGVPLVAAGDVHMHVRSRRALQDTLTAIRLGTTVKNAGHHLYPNGERHLRRRDELARLYPAELLTETVRIAEHCRFSLDELRYEYPKELVPPGETPKSYLRKLTEIGVHERWPQGLKKRVRQQIEHELQLIAELQYESYFLTVHDIVSFAKNQGILCQGRGSAANSAVCYCLGITEVDPARMEILFERFISKDRNEPPDIDVDFEHERREEVIQHIYSKYGRNRAALAATVITYRLRSAIRDVGKALGLSFSQVDRLAKSLAWWDGKQIIPERLREVGFDPDNPVIRHLINLVNALVGFPRHLSQHVGGFVISQDALSRLVPIENAAMPERTVIQWDKDDLDALGLLKVDVLGLGMLSAIHRAFTIIENYRGKRLTLSTIPAEDPAVYEMIQHADTIGVFQIESRAQMSMLPRLKPKTFYDLVIEVAIVRPGPIQGNMVHPYLRRRQGREPVTYPSPAVREVLERTLGVPIFQEQVIKLAMVAAGFSAGEADRLRRAMAAWRRKGGLESFERRLIEGMRERGYSEDFAQRIFQQIQGFGEYGFPESHAASFALLVYISAWLKCYELAAFTCALLNSQPMGFYAPAQLIQDARRHGVKVRAVDVCASSWDCTLEKSTRSPCGRGPGGGVLRLGLRMVKGFSRAGADRLVAARTRASFANTEDLARRAKLSCRDLDVLAAAGALVTLAGNRRQAYWQILGIEDPLPTLQDASIPEGLPMLRQPTVTDNTVADYKHLGFTLGQHPLGLLRSRLNRLQVLTAAELKVLPHGHAARTAGLVITRQRPGTATGVIFLTLEDETGHFNVVVWGRLADKQRREVLGARLLGVVGEIQREGEVLHVIAKQLQDHSALLGQLATHSRDFH
ncbi:MAG: error-prone DNA polymerase [Gammaproteobacteria bacterium]|nr:error-prone DNA polymerase [Gammaproteobacteria bacterium]